jgi:TRAP transporter 4TM/12TM fusion protein
LDQIGKGEHPIRGWTKRIVSLLLILSGFFYLYTAAMGQWGMTRQRGILLTLCLIAVFLVTNPTQKLSPRLSLMWDLFLSLLTVATYIPALLYDLAGESRAILGPSQYEVIGGGLLILLLIEASRRAIGLPFIFLCAGGLAFCKWGYLISKVIPPQSGGWPSIIDYITYSGYGIYGSPLYVASTVVVVLVIFGGLLKNAGGHTLFNELPQTLFGTTRGGPAKGAVVGSSIMGMLSGSPAANVATVGVFTIPMMKNAGYSPKFAAAIETAASVGGQIMPPIMGAVAFVMADILQISYWEIALAAFIPACLYYLCLFLQVDFHAAKIGLKGVSRSQLPPFKKTVIRSLPMTIPIGALIFGLGVMAVTPQKAGLMAIAGLGIASLLYKESRLTLKRFYLGVLDGMQTMIQIGIACAAAGIVLASIDLTGVGVTISSTLIDLSGGNLVVLTLLVAITSIVLGTGLSTTPCYLLLAFVCAPAMIKMGVPPMNAHLFILYYGCLSQLSPPEGLAGYTAAGIAGANVFTSMFLSCRIAIIAFIVPFFFIFHNNLLLQGSLIDIVISIFFAVVGVMALSVALEGYALTRMKIIDRVLAALLGLVMIAPTSLLVNILCMIAFLFIVFWRKFEAVKAGEKEVH